MSKAERNRQRAREKIAQAQAEEARRKQRRLGRASPPRSWWWRRPSPGSRSDSAAAAPTPPAPAPAPQPRPALHPRLAEDSTAACSTGPEGVPIPAASPLATTSTKATGGKIDGISCQTNEQTIFHIHAHLTVSVNGVARQIPAGIGIPGAKAQNTAQGQFIASGNCFYRLHTHARRRRDHLIESPIHRIDTLGDSSTNGASLCQATHRGRPGSWPRHRHLPRSGLPTAPARASPQRPRPDPAGSRTPLVTRSNNPGPAAYSSRARRRPRAPHPGDSGSRSTTQPRTAPGPQHRPVRPGTDEANSDGQPRTFPRPRSIDPLDPAPTPTQRDRPAHPPRPAPPTRSDPAPTAARPACTSRPSADLRPQAAEAGSASRLPWKTCRQGAEGSPRPTNPRPKCRNLGGHFPPGSERLQRIPAAKSLKSLRQKKNLR